MLDFLVVALVPMILVVVIIALLRGRRKNKKPAKVDNQTRLERAVWGWARVLEMSSQAAESGSRARVRLTLEIHTPGTPPYTGTTTWLVEREALTYVEVGKEISLKVDPQDLKYIYPNGPWAKYIE